MLGGTPISQCSRGACSAIAHFMRLVDLKIGAQVAIPCREHGKPGFLTLEAQIVGFHRSAHNFSGL